MSIPFPTPTPESCRLAHAPKAGCDWCGCDLVEDGWCGEWCRNRWTVNHSWKAARREARLRAGHKCFTCGSMEGIEVHHIQPLRVMGYSASCWHHQDNLQVLCGPCHEAATFIQRLMWDD